MKSYCSLMGLGITIIIITVGFTGCEAPQPYSSIPNVILYHVVNETRVFVSGEGYMYENINITIDNVTKEESFSYGLTSSTHNTSFRVEIRVLDNQSDDDKEDFINYAYSASVRVDIDHEKAYFYLTDTHHKDEVKRKSPYKTLMEND